MALFSRLNGTKCNLVIQVIDLNFKVGFVLSWTPYAIVTFYAAFLGHDLAPMAGTLPAMFAKSAFLWSSVIYIYSNRQVREKTFAWLGYHPQAEEVKKVEISPSRSNNSFFKYNKFNDVNFIYYVYNKVNASMDQTNV